MIDFFTFSNSTKDVPSSSGSEHMPGNAKAQV